MFNKSKNTLFINKPIYKCTHYKINKQTSINKTDKNR